MNGIIVHVSEKLSRRDGILKQVLYETQAVLLVGDFFFFFFWGGGGGGWERERQRERKTERGRERDL